MIIVLAIVQSFANYTIEIIISDFSGKYEDDDQMRCGKEEKKIKRTSIKCNTITNSPNYQIRERERSERVDSFTTKVIALHYTKPTHNNIIKEIYLLIFLL